MTRINMARSAAYLLILGLFIFTNCKSTVSGPAPAPTTQPVVPGPLTETWQQKWDKLVSDGKKEGKVVICSSTGPSVREALIGAFTGKYGIELEFISAKPAELVPKIQAERRSGLYLADLFIAGTGTVVPNLGPDGALEPIDSALLLPEVSDGRNWWGGNLLWTDPNHLQLAFLAYPEDPILINTDAVKSDDLKTYRDLLSPKWKGKISYIDPTMAGHGNSFFTFTADLFGLDYLRDLGKQELVFTKDARLQMEWVARGKYPVAIYLKPELITEFKKAGAPIKAVALAEGTFIESAGGGLVLMNKAPHPKAAALFINWLLSKEGQTIVARAYGVQSAREDVPTDFLEPEVTRKPGVKYYSLIGEAAEAKKRQYMKAAGEIWGHLLK